MSVGDGLAMRSLLRRVSRSFALSLEILPGRVRGVMGVGYLLARATDTVADVSAAPREVRLEALRSIAGAVCGGALSPAIGGLAGSLPAGAERELLESLGEVIRSALGVGADVRGELERVIGEIVRGQVSDIERLERGDGVVALAGAAELEEYTQRVAGSVGIFWTRVCGARLRGYARIDPAELERLGARFGRGLQLVNILRDLPSDLDAGRCYLPSDELGAAGLTAGAIAPEPALAAPVAGAWFGRAREYLRDGIAYAAGIRGVRVRTACLLPARLGLRTLDAVEERFGERGIKVGRGELRRLLPQVLWESVTGIRPS